MITISGESTHVGQSATETKEGECDLQFGWLKDGQDQSESRGNLYCRLMFFRLHMVKRR